ncbi:hypothetical protein CWE09_07520 [Aliidiomarina minuta]|uniref:Uncharacterized protein n=1 Tax=Aliidiomarina minuta TaxID=880057 RepID=A0A432WAC1_9GAMM|nr:hypothetical protein [Aliidiomarina minuta]RUO26548.1 hypothetical protein CWE09_07520 [Aliidiomarina minuta]
MSLELFFSAAGLLTIPAWLVLMLSPRRISWERYVIGLVAIALSILYAGLLAAFWYLHHEELVWSLMLLVWLL